MFFFSNPSLWNNYKKKVRNPKRNKLEGKSEAKKIFEEEIEYVKAFSRQLRIDRFNWYFDEIGIKDNSERIKVKGNTDLIGPSKPYELIKSY